MQLDDPVCYCFHVSKRKVLNFLRVHQPRRASQLSQCGGAGTGCGWCVPFLKKYFREAQGETVELQEPTSAEAYAQQRAGYIRSGGGTPAPGAIALPDEGDDASS